MAIPVIPAGLSVVYNPDYYANTITITAGDANHTGFRIYRNEGEPYGWEQVSEVNTTDMVFTAYMGSESDSMKSWGVTAFNEEGESARLDSNPGVPPAQIANFSAVRTTNPGEVALSWAWSGDSKAVYLFAASEYEASTNYWYEKGSANAQDLSALITDIPRFKTFIIRLYATNSTYQQTPLAEYTLQPVSLENLPAPTAITASLSRLDRMLIDFDAVSWEDAPDFQYRFTFQRGTDDPIIIDHAWGVLTVASESIHRQLSNEVPGITFENAAEWTCTLQGISAIGSGDISAPFTLMQEPPADFLSFSMDETAQISWVFSDWQNALPLEVETRIDGGPWLPTFITNESRTNDELYGDRCIIGDDWSGGVLGRAHFYWPFNNQPHTVEARARIQGSSDAWLYGPAEHITLRSLYYPELLWGSHPFQGQNGTIDLPEPTLLIRRHPNYERYTLEVAVDDGAFLPFADVLGSTTARTATTWTNLIAHLPEFLQDGGSHRVQLRLNVIQGGQVTFRYPLQVHDAVIPQSTALVPKGPDWTITTREDSSGMLFILAANARDPHRTTFQYDIDGAATTPQEIPDGDPYRKTFRIALPDPDGLCRIITCTITTHSPRTGKSSDQGKTVSYTQKLPKPVPPAALNAELQRQANGEIPDRVRLTWPAGQLVQLIGQLGTLVFSLGYADSTESEAIIENTRTKLPKNGALCPVQFGIRTYHRDAGVSAARLANAIPIRAYPAPQASPDVETDIDLFDAKVLEWIKERIALAFPAVSEVMRSLITTNAVRSLKQEIKAIVATGGSATLDNLGVFAAKWSKERFDGRGNKIPAERGLEFMPSIGFVEGVKAGTVLSDTEAEAQT